MSTVAELSFDELVDLSLHGTDEEGRAAAVELHRRHGFGLWVDAPEPDAAPTDWHADRACDAWERGRDAIAERVR